MRIEEVRGSLGTRLRARRPEIEEAALARVYAVADPAEDANPRYIDSLRAAVSAAIDYGIAALERSADRPPAVPMTLLAQARLAARSNVSLDTVLRRYLAGYTLLGDFIIEESERSGVASGPDLRSVLRTEAALFDRLLATITDEYNREAPRGQSPQRLRAERVERLLAGELLEAPELEYDFSAHHLGLVAAGADASPILRRLGREVEARLLLVQRSESVSWCWLGSREEIKPQLVERKLRESSGAIPIAIGEPAAGLAGWRLTHRQAEAAFALTRGDGGPVVRYADVALLSSMLRDDLLVSSLSNLYLEPLSHGSGGGVALRETLRAYLAHDRNVSSTAAAMGVSRQTVNRRLREIEERLGRSLSGRALEIEAALMVDQARRAASVL